MIRVEAQLKQVLLIIYAHLIIFALAGCRADRIHTGDLDPLDSAMEPIGFPTLQIRTTVRPPAASASKTPPRSHTPTAITQLRPESETQYPSETRLKTQCLDIERTFSGEIFSSGFVWLQDWESVVGRSQADIFIVNMKTGERTQIAKPREIQGSHSTSPNKNLIAYSSVIFDEEGKIESRNLVIADAIGRQLNIIPWEENWDGLIGWLGNELLAINLTAADLEEFNLHEPGSTLVLNPFTGEEQLLEADYPAYLDASSTVLPNWESWQGVIFEPTLTRVIYPYQFNEKNEDVYTFALWDLEGNQLVTSLEAIFTTFSIYNFYPMPRWSPDSSQFILLGVDMTSDSTEVAAFELYRISRYGQIDRLTNLAEVAYIWESSYSWSPDGRYIALYLGPPSGAYFEKARVAVLDTITLDVTDLCFPIAFHGEGYGLDLPLTPIWSPDSSQFLVIDWAAKDQRRVFSIDIQNNIAVKVEDNMQPVGWLLDASSQ